MSERQSETLKPTPRHVAVIMDGNGRWAKRRGMPRVAGHRQGVSSVRNVLEAAGDAGVEVLTLFSFSSENWRRPAVEVEELMGLLRRYLKSEIAELHASNVRFTVIGDRDELAPDIIQLIEEAERTTSSNTGLTLVLALNYGGRGEIANAVRRIAKSVELGLLKPEAVEETLFESYLWTVGLPDPDLVIRTSGEKRISNFLLWQCAYAEFVFVDKLWPDFGKDDFHAAIDEYRNRERRFGASADRA